MDSMLAVRADLGLNVVPCNGCTRCCRGDAVRILPHEDAARWQTVAHPYKAGARMLAQRADGACVYLSDSGCTRQNDKPQQCHDMDCRNIARAVNFTMARKLDAQGALPLAVWRRGRELLKA